MNKKFQLNIWQTAAGLILAVLVGLGLGVQHPEWMHLTSSSKQPDFASLETLYSTLQSKYDGTLDPTKVLDGARAGLVSAAGDPYTEYLTSAQAKDLQDSLSGTLSGIGVEVGLKNNRLTVIAPVAGTPADKAGLKAGDAIASIDGVDSSTLTLDQSVAKIRGNKGTQVKLVIIRGSNEPMTITITRDVITVPSVKTEIKPGNVGLITISEFGTDTGTLVQQAATQFKAAGVSKIIIDVRDNPGGYLDQAVSVASEFLPKGETVVSERKGSSVLDTMKSSGGDLNDARVVIMINSGSASASEILAGALGDNHRATTLGVTSFGKGSVQEIQSLGDGDQLKVTIAHWYTPNGVNINKSGIKPNQIVTLSQADSDAGRDPQLDAALKDLQ